MFMREKVPFSPTFRAARKIVKESYGPASQIHCWNISHREQYDRSKARSRIRSAVFFRQKLAAQF